MYLNSIFFKQFFLIKKCYNSGLQIIYVRSVNYAFILGMSKVLRNIYIWVFLVSTECVLFLAFVKYMLYSHFTENCIFLYFLEAKNPCLLTKNCWKSSYNCVFIFTKKRHNWFYKNLHNSGIVGRRKLPDPSLNCILNALSIRIKYTLPLQWTNFSLKCLLLRKIKICC